MFADPTGVVQADDKPMLGIGLLGREAVHDSVLLRFFNGNLDSAQVATPTTTMTAMAPKRFRWLPIPFADGHW